MKTAIIYARVSTIDKQDAQRQIKELKAYAKYMNFNIIGEYEDKITGASKALERIEFSKMLDYINNNSVDNILVWELSRLGRNMRDVINTVADFTESGINIHITKDNLKTLNEDGEENAITKIIISVLSGFDEIERAVFKARSKSGLRYSASLGKAGGGAITPYGYMKDEHGFLVIDPEEAEVIQTIFTKYISGLGTQKLMNYLNNKNIPTRYNKAFLGKKIKNPHRGIEVDADKYKWKDATIYSILKNSIYMGKRRFKGEIFDVPGIISEETYNQVQIKLDSHHNKKGINSKYPKIFKDKIICDDCGNPYFMHKRENNKDNAYKCLSKRAGYANNCKNPSINIDKLNNAVYDYVIDELKIASALEKFEKNDKLKSLNEDLKTFQIELDDISVRKTKLQKQKERLLDLYLDGMDISLYTKKNTQLLKQESTLIKQHQKALNDVEKLTSLKSSLKDFSKVDLTNVEIFKEYIHEMIDYIKIIGVKENIGFDEFPNRQDVPVLVELKTNMLVNDQYHYFLISQRSDKLIHLDITHLDNIQHNLAMGNFEYDVKKIENRIIID